MQLILAIDSDPRRSEQLATLVRARLQVDLVQATSAGEGLHALRDRVPDLILTSPLLSPFDDGVLDEYLRDLGSSATHVQTVRIPMLSSGPRKKSAANRLFSLGRKKTPTSSAAPDGCDPKVFADEIAHYLTRSLEERAASASSKAAPARSAYFEPEPVVQQRVDIWGAAEALVREFRETAPAATFAKASTPKAPEPVVEPTYVEPSYVEPTYVPGSILDLRTPIVHSPARRVVPDPEPLLDLAQAEPAFVEPEPPAYVEPERLAYVEPETPSVIEPEPLALVEPEPLAYIEPDLPTYGARAQRARLVEPEPVDVAPLDFAQRKPFDFALREPVFVEPEPISAPVEPRPPVLAQPKTPVTQTPAPATGNSASFEAALAAIRAAWAKPEPKTPSPDGTAAPAGDVRPLAGSGEVDLTNALEDVTGVDGSTPARDNDAPADSKTPDARRTVEKLKKRPEKPGARTARGPDDREDWGVLDPNQYEFSALVNKLDEVTDSDKVTTRATNDR
jgi:hypothetical protein